MLRDECKCLSGSETPPLLHVSERVKESIFSKGKNPPKTSRKDVTGVRVVLIVNELCVLSGGL